MSPSPLQVGNGASAADAFPGVCTATLLSRLVLRPSARHSRSSLRFLARALRLLQIETLSQHTSIPAAQLKLISNGAVLKNPALPLTSFGLRDGSAIVLVGADQAVPAASSSSSGGGVGGVGAGGAGTPAGKKKEVVPDTEPGLVEYIRGKTQLVDELREERERYMADVDVYCGVGAASASGSAPTLDDASRTTPGKPTSSTLPSTAPSHPAPQSALPAAPVPSPPTPTFTTLERSHARLSEILLQGLLALDGTTVPPDWTQARAARKEAVRSVQRGLDEVDEAWARCKKRRREGGGA